jgi:P4 family phage/plasmid primase-like protien
MLSAPDPEEYLQRLHSSIRYHGANGKTMFSSSIEEINYHNAWADYWHYFIGVNVIPVDSHEKRPIVKWKPWQNRSLPEDLFGNWKLKGLFHKGLAIIPGRVWHRDDKKHLYFVSIDVDNDLAIEELCTRNRGKSTSLHQISDKFLVEQHKDNLNRAHISFYSPVRFPHKIPDQVTGIEIKSLGEDGNVVSCPSEHKNGHRYDIIGTLGPITLTMIQATEFIQHIDQICKRHGMRYLERANPLSGKIKMMVKSFNIDNDILEEGHRHSVLISIANSILFRYLGKKSEDDLKNYFLEINSSLCKPFPLAQEEIISIWNSARKFAKKRIGDESLIVDDDQRHGSRCQIRHSSRPIIIEEASEAIMQRFYLITDEASKEILYYDNGVYISGGQIMIEKELERMYGYELKNIHIQEVIGHIMRRTYIGHDQFDKDVNIINVRNGLYNITTGKLKPHSPSYISRSQKPIVYNAKAKAYLFGKFLKETLYPDEIRTAIELMAYTLLRANPHEIYVILIGTGANGKSVFTAVLVGLHGIVGVSNVPLHSLIKDRFALSDLENKDVNIDTELSTGYINDISILKRLTGSLPTRIERKNQRAYDIILHTKLFFNANRLPMTDDNSDARFRREITIAFPNQFEDGNADINLQNKLTSEKELSGIFNVLMNALRRVLQTGRIQIKHRTIQQRRNRHDMMINSVDSFVRDAIAQDPIQSCCITKEQMYEAYTRFCSYHSLPVERKESFGKLIKKQGIVDGRENIGERKTIWKNIKLVKWIKDMKEVKTIIEC